MPKTAPSIKIEAVAAIGGEIVLEGLTYDDANRFALDLASRTGRAFVHPFNDPDVIAGQGTIAVELEQQWTAVPDAVFVPVGGGGLIGGIGAYLKQRHPEVMVIGVEPLESASMYESLKRGAPFTLDHVGTFADGVAVRTRGRRDVSARTRSRRRDHPREHRRDLRRNQGHLRGQPSRRRARRRARRSGPQALARAASGPRPRVSSPSTAART